MKDLLNDADRQELCDTLKEMYAPLGAKRFIIVAITGGDARAFLTLIYAQNQPAPDYRNDLMKILISPEVDTMIL